MTQQSVPSREPTCELSHDERTVPPNDEVDLPARAWFDEVEHGAVAKRIQCIAHLEAITVDLIAERPDPWSLGSTSAEQIIQQAAPPVAIGWRLVRDRADCGFSRLDRPIAAADVRLADTEETREL